LIDKYGRTSIYLYPDQKGLLKKIAKEYRQNVSSLVRETINEFLKNHLNPEDPIYQRWKREHRSRELIQKIRKLRENRDTVTRDGSFNKQFMRQRLGGSNDELATPMTNPRWNPTYLPQRPLKTGILQDPKERRTFFFTQKALEKLASELREITDVEVRGIFDEDELQQLEKEFEEWEGDMNVEESET